MYSQYSQTVIPKSYGCKTLEGNWYEDRCTSKFDHDNNKKKYSLQNQYDWQYDTTNKDIGKHHSNYSTINKNFGICNDNYINFQEKKHSMYISTSRNSYDEKYKDSFYNIKPFPNYYKGKEEELNDYRKTWTKRDHLYDTTYKDDLLKTFMVKRLDKK